ncbi:MAG: MFS transporter [Bdellovibrionales bacterium]|nr:MFS transporter [Bdellovibrionales bacterium]
MIRLVIKNGKFYLSCLLAFTAGHVTNYSVILFSQDFLKSDFLSGVGFGLCFGPPLILGWVAGVWCDRISPIKIIHAGGAVFILSNLLLLAGAQQGSPAAAVPWILSGAFFAGVAWSFVSPARMTALRLFMSESDLKPASLFFNLLVMLGFGLGPMVIAFVRTRSNWNWVFMTAMVFFVISSALLLNLKTRSASAEKGAKKRTVTQDVLTGIQAVTGNRYLRELMICAVFGYMLMGPLQVIVPKLATRQLGLSELERGSLLGALAPSFIVGGALCAVLMKKIRNGWLILASIALAAVCFGLLSQYKTVQIATALISGVGIMGGIAISTIVSLIQAHASDATRGRVTSMYTITSQVMPAVSGLLSGILIHKFGEVHAALTVGVFLFLAMLLHTVWMKNLRSLP